MDESITPGEMIARLPGGLAPRSLSLYRVLVMLVAFAIAIGDSDTPVLSTPHYVAVCTLAFPMFYIDAAFGDPLRGLVGDTHSLDICMGVNALVWSGIEHWLLPSPITSAMHCVDFGAELLWPGNGVIELYRQFRE